MVCPCRRRTVVYQRAHHHACSDPQVRPVRLATSIVYSSRGWLCASSLSCSPEQRAIVAAYEIDRQRAAGTVFFSKRETATEGNPLQLACYVRIYVVLCRHGSPAGRRTCSYVQIDTPCQPETRGGQEQDSPRVRGTPETIFGEGKTAATCAHAPPPPPCPSCASPVQR